jgi:hypothetical protein
VIDHMRVDAEITALAFRYARAIDTKDWDLLRGCFMQDAVAHYSTGAYAGVDAIDELCRRLFTPLDATQHLVTNVESMITGRPTER